MFIRPIFLRVFLWTTYYLGPACDWLIVPESGSGAANFSSQAHLSWWSEAMGLAISSHNLKHNIQPLVKFGQCNSRSTLRDQKALARIYLGIYEGKVKSSSLAYNRRKTREKRPFVGPRTGTDVTSTLA